MMTGSLKFLFVGDLIGEPGLALFAKWVPVLKQEHALDAVIVNGENSAKNGSGITPQVIEFLKKHGATVITTGNHAFDSKDSYQAFNERDDLLRPLNYPSECPGKGYTTFTIGQHTVAVVNAHGRVFIKELMDCPFRAMESLLT